MTLAMKYAVDVVPTGNEQSLDDFKHQYESSDWSIAEATCVKRRIREEARLEGEGCDGRTFIFNAEEDGLFLHGREEKWCDGRRFVFNGDDLEASSTKVSFPLPWGAGTVQLSLTRPEQRECDGKVDIDVMALGKIVPLRVRLDSTTSEIKWQIFDKEGIPFNDQRIFIYGEQCENDTALAYYGIEEGDCLDLFLPQRGGMYHPSSGRDGLSTRPEQRECDGKVDIDVMALGKIVPLRVRLDSTTISEVKMQILIKEGIPFNDQRIFICGEQCENDTALAYYGIEEGDCLDLFLPQRGGMYHPSSGRDGLSKIGEERSRGTVKVKYGPGEDDLLSIELDEDETCKSLVGKVKERLAAIEELSRELSRVKLSRVEWSSVEATLDAPARSRRRDLA